MKGTTRHEEAERDKEYLKINIHRRKGGMNEKRQGRQTRAGLNESREKREGNEEGMMGKKGKLYGKD